MSNFISNPTVLVIPIRICNFLHWTCG